jgi:hypothetical protein
MGVVILPLLVLMTVGIVRRVSDYGLTINRCYILLANLWFYGIYIYLFLVRGRRVKWILISLVAIALVASAGPWSMSNVTRRSIESRITAYLGGKPLSVENPPFDLADKEGIGGLRSHLRYLDRNYGEESLRSFLSDEIADMEISEIFQQFEFDVVDEVYKTKFSSENTVGVNQILHPGQRYAKFTAIEWWSDTTENEQVAISKKGEDLIVRIMDNEGDNGGYDDVMISEFRVPLRQVAEHSVIEGDGFTLYVTVCEGRLDNDRSETGGIDFYHVAGYLFY